MAGTSAKDNIDNIIMELNSVALSSLGPRKRIFSSTKSPVDNGEKKKLPSEAEAHEKTVESYQSRVNSSFGRISKLVKSVQKESHQLESNESALTEKLNEIEDQLSSMSKSLKLIRKKFKIEAESLDKELAKQHKSEAFYSSKEKIIEKEQNEKNAEIKKLKSTLLSTNLELGNVRDETREIEEKIANEERKQSEYQKDSVPVFGIANRIKGALEGEPERLIPFYSDIKLAFLSLNGEKEKLNRQKEKLDKEKNSLESELNEKSHKLDEINEQLNECREHLQECREKIQLTSKKIKSTGFQMTAFKNVQKELEIVEQEFLKIKEVDVDILRFLIEASSESNSVDKDALNAWKSFVSQLKLAQNKYLSIFEF